MLICNKENRGPREPASCKLVESPPTRIMVAPCPDNLVLTKGDNIKKSRAIDLMTLFHGARDCAQINLIAYLMCS